ncbi:hypothetical protein [Nocardia cyriacigeorgica]|uniref:hypothetical protein n=1 Tax=Nocardia cyriacigeorgica TaxID=135487 RepID=UPI002016F530|nr:hypothetical protein [Nocardia cyriacigeorgica]
MQAFVDETKQNGFLIAATFAEGARIDPARKAMRQLLAGGQSRIHFKKESDPRRRAICSAICELDIQIAVYDATQIRNAASARTACLHAVVEDLAACGGTRLVLETDDSLIDSDKRVLYQAVRKLDVADSLTYHHMRPSAEPILWISDAAAWCVAKGGPWRRRVDPVIDSVRKLV